MVLIGSPSSFVWASSKKSSVCSECHEVIPARQNALVAYRHGRAVKRVCSDVCRETFDDHFWQERADDRQAEAL